MESGVALGFLGLAMPVVGDRDREAVILEVHGEDGAPPYLVRWSDGHESEFFPSSDTAVEHQAADQSTE